MITPLAIFITHIILTNVIMPLAMITLNVIISFAVITSTEVTI